MANISKITDVLGNTYNIKDEVARDRIENLAPFDSPVFIGKPQAPTPSNETNNTEVATTQFVHSVINSAYSFSVNANDGKLYLITTV